MNLATLLRPRIHREKDEKTAILQQVIDRLKEIMASLHQERQKLQKKHAEDMIQLRRDFESLLLERDRQLEQMRLEMRLLEQSNRELEKSMRQQLDSKEQSVQLLKNILKKRIIQEVTESRQHNDTIVERRHERISIQSSGPFAKPFNERHWSLSPGGTHCQTTTCSSLISEMWKYSDPFQPPLDCQSRKST